MSSKFAISLAYNNKLCKNKHRVLTPILESLSIPIPEKYYALLMPCLYGKEAYYLQSRGVPTQNMFAVERDPQIFKEIQECKRKDRQILKGMQTASEIPISMSQAIERVKYKVNKFNLIYLDYFGKPQYKEHYKFTLKRIFQLDLLQKDGIMILTFINTRERKGGINESLLKKFKEEFSIKYLSTQVLVRAAAVETGYRKPIMKDYIYKSSSGENKLINCVTTVVKFKEK